jgi:hypothetical protein
VSGIRNRQGDPSLCLKKILCLGERVWEELREVVEKEGWGGDVWQPAALPVYEDEEGIEDGEPFPEDHRCLEIALHRLPWWEVEHWEEIHDETRCWGDLSREDQRTLRKLLGRE